MTGFSRRAACVAGNSAKFETLLPHTFMKSRLLLLAGFGLMLGLVPSLRAADAPTLAGSWKLDVARSSPIRPWDLQTMTIAVTGDSVVITRNLAWGDTRKVTDTTAAVTDAKTATANPVGYWLDTWYTNVYIGGDHLSLPLRRAGDGELADLELHHP